MSSTGYMRQLHKILDDIYQESQDLGWSWARLALEADLCYSTVCKLGNNETRFPRFLTIQKLSKAVGWSLTLQQSALLRKVG